MPITHATPTTPITAAGSYADAHVVSVPGSVIHALATGVAINSGSQAAATASQAQASTIVIPHRMLVESLVQRVATGGSGTCQWGLFDPATPTAATKLAGGSGALNATGWQAIAASGAPVTVEAGCYILIFHWPSANRPNLMYTDYVAAFSFSQFQNSYVWDDTPDLTTGWTEDSVVWNGLLKGRLTASELWP